MLVGVIKMTINAETLVGLVEYALNQRIFTTTGEVRIAHIIPAQKDGLWKYEITMSPARETKSEPATEPKE